MAKCADWVAMRDDYLHRAGSTADLAEKYGVPLKSVERRCAADGWVALRALVDRLGTQEAVERAVGDGAEYRTRICLAAMALLSQIEGWIEESSAAGARTRSVDLLNVARALQSVKDIVDVRAPGDLEEQTARIAKLRAEAEKSDERDAVVRVEIAGGMEDLAE